MRSLWQKNVRLDALRIYVAWNALPYMLTLLNIFEVADYGSGLARLSRRNQDIDKHFNHAAPRTQRTLAG